MFVHMPGDAQEQRCSVCYSVVHLLRLLSLPSHPPPSHPACSAIPCSPYSARYRQGAMRREQVQGGGLVEYSFLHRQKRLQTSLPSS